MVEGKKREGWLVWDQAGDETRMWNIVMVVQYFYEWCSVTAGDVSICEWFSANGWEGTRFKNYD